MSLAIVIPGVTFSKFIGQVELPQFGPDGYPVTDGLEAYYLLKTDGPTAANNFVTGKPDASVIGAPAFSAQSAVTNRAACLETGRQQQTTACTFIVIAKPFLTGDGQFIIGNYAGEAVGSVGLAIGMNAGLLLGVAEKSGGGGSSTSLSLSGADTSKWNFMACVFNGATMKLYRGVDGVLTAGNLITDNTIVQSNANARNLRIGGSYAAGSTGFDHAADVAAGVIHSAALSATQIGQAYSFFKTKYDGLGLVGL